MALPYHLLKVCGSIIFAAQGSDIHSFNSSLEPLSTWKYPVKQGEESAPPEPQESPAPEGPPAKRRKVEDGQGAASNDQAEEPANGQPKSKKNAPYDVPANERPFVQGLYATTDGRHLVAITGSDKTIWVFEHDGAGNLKQLSQRAMPKRPCSLALTTDNRTILSADKFGDVYALPLLPSSLSCTSSAASPSPAAPSPELGGLPLSRSATPVTTSGSPAPFKPQANELTVHTKRNLKALENQLISMNRKKQQDQQNQQQQRPQFEHALLLGHVSMLTAICVGVEQVALADGSLKTREYILTADRDEHIRVSRGMPQAHVIEGFCLGHEDFVSRLCMAPGGRQGVLISGGGDDDLFVWDWVKGTVIGKAGVLEHVKGVVGEDVNKVAVTRVFDCQLAGRTTVLVVVERVPALFCYELLKDNTLQHRETIQLPGNSLDVEVIESTGSAPRLLVGVDPAEENSSSLIVLDKEVHGDAGWRQSKVQNLPTAGEHKISRDELEKILYTTESLRKLSDFD
ncbi:hypothetical protein VTI74DRAFT_5776 [Chaetomium olivicolor]